MIERQLGRPQLHFFCKNRLYKNNEVETGQKIRTNLEHFVAKDKKIRMMNKHVRKE